jgi:hypothetical protein
MKTLHCVGITDDLWQPTLLSLLFTVEGVTGVELLDMKGKGNTVLIHNNTDPPEQVDK